MGEGEGEVDDEREWGVVSSVDCAERGGGASVFDECRGKGVEVEEWSAHGWLNIIRVALRSVRTHVVVNVH